MDKERRDLRNKVAAIMTTVYPYAIPTTAVVSDRPTEEVAETDLHVMIRGTADEAAQLVLNAVRSKLVKKPPVVVINPPEKRTEPVVCMKLLDLMRLLSEYRDAELTFTTDYDNA